MNPKLVQLIVHCYAVKFPEFAKLLTAQLSSLKLHSPSCHVLVSACTTPDDKLTLQVCDAFRDMVPIEAAVFPESHVFRRAVLRNELALTTDADVVWFADADYLFGPGCLDALVLAMDACQSRVAFPKTVLIHRSHQLGDDELSRIVPGKLWQSNLDRDYAPRRETKAIGGCQIVTGATARQFGYCNGTQWATPVRSDSFLNTFEDKAFRLLMGGSSPIELPNVYRMRHSASQWQTAEHRLSQTQHEQ